MVHKHLHIVSFDVPYPPDYGGAIDVYFKIKALHELGIRVHLHCFEYGRKRAPQLNAICEKVTYYKRDLSKRFLLHALPFTVITRRSGALLDNLTKDDDPILFEGLHTCFYLGDPSLHGRVRLVRAHNVEHDYYAALAKAESSAFRRTYYLNEARKLEKFEPILAEAKAILAISHKDHGYFNRRFNNAQYVPAFHPSHNVDLPKGMGEPFALYHGSLGVSENDKAALFLIRKVFNGTEVKLVIAGSDASTELKKEVAKHRNVQLLEDVAPEKIDELVGKAQVNVLPTFQATGIKLKLLLCLFNGRHLVCNAPMVEDTGLAELCVVRDDPDQMRAAILDCMLHELNGTATSARKRLLEEQFSPKATALKLVDLFS